MVVMPETDKKLKLVYITPALYMAGGVERVLTLKANYFAEHFGYDITILKDHIRFLEVIANRDGEMGGLLPLWFDGAVCDFKELPKVDDKTAITKIYNCCKVLEATGKYSVSSSSKATTLLLPLKRTIKHIINFHKF
jgi:hypothetical protein